MKHRRVKHYGFEFRYDNNNVDKDRPLPAGESDFPTTPPDIRFHHRRFKITGIICFLSQGIPVECLPFLERCLTNRIIDVLPDQLTVNQYESGQG